MTRWRVLLAATAALTAVVPAPLSAQSPGDQIEVTAASAAVRDGASALVTVDRGRRFVVKAVNPPWVQVEVAVDGTTRAGWILDRDVRVISPAADAPPAVRRWVRVKTERADVSLGRDVVGGARQGEVFEVVKVNDGWFLVDVESQGTSVQGYLSPGSVTEMSAREVGPGTGDRSPASILVPTVSVDWTTNVVTLSAPLPTADETAEVRLADAAPEDADSVVIARDGGLVGIRAPWHVVRDALAPGTRSLWVAEGTRRWHRLDLPAPRLAPTLTVTKQADGADVIGLTLSATNVLPSFIVEQRESFAANTWSRAEPIRRGADCRPRLADTRGVGAETIVSLLLAPRASVTPGTTSRVEFTLLGPDGSRSNAVQFTRRGDEVQKTGSAAAPGREAPVDVITRVPAVELLPLADAERRLRAAGLEPVVADPAGATAGDTLVMRQGIVPGAVVLYGSTVLVSCVDGVAAPAEQPSGTARFPAIDARDDFGFIDLPPLDGTARGPARSSARDPAPALDVALGAGMVPAARGDASEILTVDADPGLLVDPGLDASAAVTAATLKVLIRALERQASPDRLPGPIGRAMTEAVVTFDDDWQEALLAGTGSAADLPIEQAASLVMRNVRLSIAADDLRRLTTDWRRFARRRHLPADLDRNRNGAVADDVVIWVVGWLSRRGLYDIASHVAFIPGADEPTLVVGDDGSPKGGRDRPDPPPLVLPWLGTVAPPRGPTPGAKVRPGRTGPLGAADRAAILSDVPVGTPLVAGGDRPRQVRVPELRDQPVSAASTRLGELGLVIQEAERLFATDRVVSSAPAAGEWVTAGSDVAFSVVREVPNVKDLSQTQARKLLESWGMVPIMLAGEHPRDIVTVQTPEAGNFAPLGSRVELRSLVLVPHVVGLLHQEAVAACREADLDWRADTKAFPTDKVVRQDPEAGALAGHDAAVAMVVHVRVPSVAGVTLERARAALRDADLDPTGGGDLAFPGDIVRGQRPGAGTFVPHGSAVAMGPIVGRVPDARGMSIVDARRLLTDRERYETSVIDGGIVRGEDLVTGQNPAAGAELERGLEITLDVRVPVPDIRGQPLDRVQDLLDAAPGGLALRIQGAVARRDLVFSQDPRPRTLVHPRTFVDVVPGVDVPDIEGRPIDEATAILRRAGLDGRVVASATKPTTSRELVGRSVVEVQRPAAGIRPRGDFEFVEIITTEYVIDEAEVPDVYEQDWKVAARTLRDAGLVPMVEAEGGRQAIEAYLAGREGGFYRIYGQSPQAGARVPRGSPVILTVD